MSLSSPKFSESLSSSHAQPSKRRDLLAIVLCLSGGATGMGLITNLLTQANSAVGEANKLADQVITVKDKIAPPLPSAYSPPLSDRPPNLTSPSQGLTPTPQEVGSPPEGLSDGVCTANAVVNAASFPELPGSQNGGNIRPGPTLNQTAVNTVRNGGAVLVLEKLDGWTKVQICQQDANLPNGILIGYMDSRFVK